MEKYKVTIKPSAVKELENIPKKYLQKIVKKIQSLYHLSTLDQMDAKNFQDRKNIDYAKAIIELYIQ